MMSPIVFIKGFILNFLCCLVIALLLFWTVESFGSYLNRVLFVLGIAFFAGLLSFENWIWLYFPLDYTLTRLGDLIIGFALVGLVIAAIVKPQHKYTV